MKSATGNLKSIIATVAGFLLPLQTVWIIREGILGGVAWPLATIGLYVADIILLGFAVLGIRCAWKARQRRSIIAFVLLVLLAVVNVAVSADPWLSAIGWVRIVLFILALTALPVLRPYARPFLWGFAAAMVVHVIIGFVQFATGHGFASTLLGTAAHDAFVHGDSVIEISSGRWLRAYGGFPHPNVFGTALLVLLIILSVISTEREARVEKSRKMAGVRSLDSLRSLEMTWWGVGFLGLWAMSIIAVALTFSRAAWLGLVFLLIILAMRRATRRLAIGSGIFFLAVMTVLGPFILPRFSQSTPNEARSVSERQSGVTDALARSAMPPFLGTGLHAMPQALLATRPERDAYTAQPVHNVPLLILAELGWIGAALFLITLAVFGGRLKQCPARFSFHDLQCSRSSVLLALLPTFLVDHHLWSLPIGLMLLMSAFVALRMRTHDA